MAFRKKSWRDMEARRSVPQHFTAEESTSIPSLSGHRILKPPSSHTTQNIPTFHKNTTSTKLPEINNDVKGSKTQQESFSDLPDKPKCQLDTGIYDPKAEAMIKLLTGDNSVLMFPPLQSSTRTLYNVYDHNMIAEKKVVMEDFQQVGPISKFERDELYIPDSYRKKLSCQHCRKSYVTKMFTKSYLKRNNREPSCFGMRTDRNISGHFCDVLGKKYCSHCVERENKIVSYPSPKQPVLFRDVSHASHVGNIRRRKIGVDMSFTFRP